VRGDEEALRGRLRDEAVLRATGVSGARVGRALAEAIVAEARSAGYRRMCLDTVPSMQAAMALYESLGFTDGVPYVLNPVPGARFMELHL
jgi:ribosomal protein S18 acetylase RimI-like enzyme